jgi:hypothetical protein
MPLPARAATVRGDDYQYTVGWFWAATALTDPQIVSVTVEDRTAGSFDDVVIRRRDTGPRYLQVKSSNNASTVIDEAWLTTAATALGRSPVQHFYNTWRDLAAPGATFTLLTNRGLDHQDPLLALRDNHTELLPVGRIQEAGPTTAIGKARARWAHHLAISEPDLLAFLVEFHIATGGSEESWREWARDKMALAGLRDDDDALTRGVSIVREWVKTGAGVRDSDAIRADVADADLLARSGTLVLAIHAIDRQPTPYPVNVERDLVALYAGDEPSSRYQLRDPQGWDREVAPAIASAARELEAFRTRRVHITGSARLPLYCAIGRALPEVRRWTLSIDQPPEEWATDAPYEAVTAREITVLDLDDGSRTEDTSGDLGGDPKEEMSELAVGISLTRDLTPQVEEYVRSALPHVRRMIVLGPPGPPSPVAVQGAGWCRSWTRAARESALDHAAQVKAGRVHLFLAAPAAAGLMLGFQWNVMPETIIYEYLPAARSYLPTLTMPGS